VRICERNNSADSKVSEEGEGGGAPGARAEISPAAHGEDHCEVGCAPAARAPAAHGGPWWRRYPPAAQGGPDIRAGGCT